MSGRSANDSGVLFSSANEVHHLPFPPQWQGLNYDSVDMILISWHSTTVRNAPLGVLVDKASCFRNKELDANLNKETETMYLQ
ncbi:hypothetical protein CEXT_653321 [Caerostris extrusa]|uniref:Uncharacterized protein n=1 Tax=Caerostris extrusa TaxID=172846 RepID=A0AAV4T3D5_CAEEX|nr:hypothetical protein CEXT_653321 [Caerostris extrusa]